MITEVRLETTKIKKNERFLQTVFNPYQYDQQWTRPLWLNRSSLILVENSKEEALKVEEKLHMCIIEPGLWLVKKQTGEMFVRMHSTLFAAPPPPNVNHSAKEG